MPRGIAVDHRKTDAINYKPHLPNVKELQRFMGMMKYLVKFVKHIW